MIRALAARAARIPPLAYVLCPAAIGLALVSLGWPCVHDAPILMYVGLAMNTLGKLPYRDLFDMNPPGTHFLYALVYRLVGQSALGLRLVDLGLMAAVGAGLWTLLRPYGWAVGATAAASYAVHILGWGASQAFQREHLAMAPLAASLVLAFRVRGPVWARALAIGVLHGVMSSIKPALVVSLPVIVAGMLVYEAVPGTEATGDARRPPRWRAALASLVAAGLGVAVVWAIVLAALARTGALAGFREMVRDYWPLYAQLRWDGSVRLHPLELRRFAETGLALRCYRLCPLAALGIAVVAWRRPRGRERVLFATLAALVVAEIFYVFSSGKFWTYQYTPVVFAAAPFAGMLAASDVPGASGRSGGVRRLLVRIALAALALSGVQVPEGTRTILKGKPFPVHPDILRAKAELEARSRPGDTVQPLDVTAGAVHAMYLAHADIATSFLYDFHFYHHPTSPVTLRLRRRFLAELDRARPRFVLEATHSVWRPVGPETGTFPELDSLVARDYRARWRGERLTFYERVDSTAAPAPGP